MRGLTRGLKRLGVTFILATALSACQTTGSDKPKATPETLLEEQKAIIRASLDSGKPEAALQQLRDLVRAHPQDAGLQNLMGLTQLALKNPARAVRSFQVAFRIDKQVGTGLNLSSALCEAGDHDRAIRLLTALAKQAEKDDYKFKERIYHNLGYCYFKDNRFAKAEQWLRQALDENPTFFPSHLQLARLYERTRRPAMALRAFRRSMDYCTVCYEPVEALAQTYQRLGKPQEARRVLMQFAKSEGITPEDRSRANEMLNHITTAGLPQVKRGS